MSFSNQNSIVITDSTNNIYNFTWINDEILLVKYTTDNSVFDEVIAKNCSQEFDVTIDERDNIYLICQKNDTTISLYLYENNNWNENLLAKEFGSKIFNLNIQIIGREVHFLYAVSSNNDSRLYRIYHHYLTKDSWSTLEVSDVRKTIVLNPFQIVKNNNELFIVYYDLVVNEEQIFIKKFDTKNEKWFNSIKITNSFSSKLYVDCIKDKDDYMHLVYCEFEDGNYIIKYKKFYLESDKLNIISENFISNPSNSSYPTIVNYDDKLWIVWTEYNYLASVYSTDRGNTWSNPYLWKKSKQNDFVRYKFKTNNKNIYNLNYSFGYKPPNFTFIGFGPLDDVSEMPLLNKKKEDSKEYKDQLRELHKNIKYNDKTKYNKEDDTLTSINNKIKNIEHRLNKLEEKFENTNESENQDAAIIEIEKRIKNLEQQIQRRRRPFTR